MTPAPHQVEVKGSPAERRADLDNLKVALVASVIVAHAAMTYGAVGSWVYEDPGLSKPLELGLNVAIVLGAMFGLGLFYLIAGLLTPGPLARRGAAGMVRNRLVRLGVPLLVYIVVVWPLLRWLAERATGDTSSLWGSLRAAFSGDAVWSLGSGPLWFVAVLIGLTLLWVGWRSLQPAAPAGGGVGHTTSPRLILAASAIAVATFLVRLAFPLDSAQFLDLHVWLWPQAAVMFVLGAVGFERGWFDELPAGTRRRCGVMVLAAIVALVVLLSTAGDWDAFTGGWHWESLGLATVEGLMAVGASLLVLDWFQRRHNRYTRRGLLLARSSYAAFLAQGPVLVALALILRSIPVPTDLKFLILAIGGVTASFAFGTLLVTAGDRSRSLGTSYL